MGESVDARSRPIQLALIERHTAPSRRWPTDAGGIDREVLCDLSGEPRAPDPTARHRVIFEASRRWLACPVSLPSRARALLAIVRQPIGRRQALLRVPELLAMIDRDEIDAIGCFSDRSFPLANTLARSVGTERPNTFLDGGTQYFGEFAFEMLAVVPYAYWLYQQGCLEVTIATRDTRCLYYFSPRHLERDVDRSYVPITDYPVGVTTRRGLDVPAFPRYLDTTRWSPPPYRETFADDRFRFDKPTVVICNKTSDELYLDPSRSTNSIDPDTLSVLVEMLLPTYTVIYVRPRATDIVNDHSAVREVGDFAALERFGDDVITIQQLHRQYPELGFNELQLRVFAGCEQFVSVLGGSSYLASWFGGVNVVLAAAGWEVDCGAYENWFHKFSGARVHAVHSNVALLSAVRDLFMA